MRRIKSQSLSRLLMQLRFTPAAKRRDEIDAAERLYCVIRKDKDYPFEFVCYRITGYHAKGHFENEIIPGRQLLEDLQIFIAKLSGKLAKPVALQDERIYSINDLADTFHISAKTVDRWRKRGLIARKYLFEDGIRRLGFSQSTVDAFVQANRDLVGKATGFRRLNKAQKQQIIARARSLGAKTSLSRRQIAGQVAAELGVAHETVRATLLAYTEAHPDKPIFVGTTSVISPTQAAELYRLYRQGARVPELVARFDRSRTTIYRIINQRRAMALLAKRIEYVPSDEFLRADARARILAEPVAAVRPHADRHVESFEVAGEHLLPEYLQVLKATPVLKKDQEIALFRRYNYLKYAASEVRKAIDLGCVSSRRLGEIEDYLDQAEEIRRILVEANLRLVVSIASKHTTGGVSFAELVSKGNFALIKAVEEFDYTKGFRFGKRAALAIAKEYAKVSGRDTELSRKRARSVASIQKDLRDKAADVLAIERARQDLVQVIAEELDDREQYVVLHHFGLVGSSVRKNTKTLSRIGQDLDLSKERVRQIELAALQKLRLCLSAEQFELLTR